MSAELLVANLLRVAREDLEGARLLHANANRNAVYLCEQAAEKILRAVLTTEGVHGGIKHQLDQMVDLIPDANPLKSSLRSIEHLSAYATSYRYPTAAGRVAPSPAGTVLAADLDRVEAVLREVAERFGVDLLARDTRAGSVRPAR